jgi:N-acetyl-anhydromuramyl-L-alanine amidase AmpD
MSFLDEIVWRPQPDSQYVNEDFEKHQIVLHHTAGEADPASVIEWWNKTSERVGTAFIIAGHAPTNAKWKDGQIWQAFGSAKAAWHLGVNQKHLNVAKPGAKSATWLNMNTIGCELTCWGQLTPSIKGFKTYEGNIIPDDQVIEYTTPFRGYHFYHKYTPTQLENTRKLLVYLCDRYAIDRKFKGMEIFDVDKRALRGENGIFTHVSYRPPGEKWDCHPQPDLIDMLQSL